MPSSSKYSISVYQLQDGHLSLHISSLKQMIYSEAIWLKGLEPLRVVIKAFQHYSRVSPVIHSIHFNLQLFSDFHNVAQ